jgi:hypothetical protein
MSLRRKFEGHEREVVIVLVVIAAMLILGLALRPQTSGISGTISTYGCDSANAGPCSIRPVQADVRITDCHGGAVNSDGLPVGTPWQTSSDAEGHFHIDLAPGVYCVFASHGYGHANRLSVAVRASHVSRVDLVLAQSGMPE